MRVGWFSCGCSSLVACKMSNPDKIIYIHVANQHPDTLRFLMDARVLLDRPIEVLQSEDYVSVDDVITHHRYINGVGGARCTLELKKRVRQKWEQQNWARHTYIWGFDLTEQNRAKRTVESMPEFDHEFPLIDAGLTKADCHALCSDWGIKRPAMYDLGYPNNNCIGCVKGGARVLEQDTRGLPRRLQAPCQTGARDRAKLHQRHVPRRVGARARNKQPHRTRLLLGLRDGRNGPLSATQTGAIAHCG